MVKSVWIKHPHSKKNCPLSNGCMSCSSKSDSKMKREYQKQIIQNKFCVPTFITCKFNINPIKCSFDKYFDSRQKFITDYYSKYELCSKHKRKKIIFDHKKEDSILKNYHYMILIMILIML